MKTLIKSTMSLSIVLLTIFSTQAAIFTSESSSKSNLKYKNSLSQNNKTCYTKAVFVNGKTILQVDLPVVTIYAYKDCKNLLRVEKINKLYSPVVDLPEVHITAERVNNIFRLKNVNNGEGKILIADLPEVVISSNRICTGAGDFVMLNNYEIRLVKLSEVIINDIILKSEKKSKSLYKGSYIASVNLPVVEITADRDEKIIASNKVNKDSNDENNKPVQIEALNFSVVLIKKNEIFTNYFLLKAKNNLQSVFPF